MIAAAAKARIDRLKPQVKEVFEAIDIPKTGMFNCIRHGYR
jgi:hypothetical protein